MLFISSKRAKRLVGPTKHFIFTDRPLSVRNFFSKVIMGPPDPIFSLSESYKADKNPNKVNVGVGAYCDDDGMPWVLPSVQKAEDRICNKQMNKEYCPIIGIDTFYNKSIELALGKDSHRFQDKSYATCQAISGAGALSVGAIFLQQWFNGSHDIYVPTPTWPIHNLIFKISGLKVNTYHYYDPKTIGLDFNGMLADICKIPEKSIILLHACAHNPTGIDPTTEQWQELSQLIKERNIFPFFDLAYQGFASGDIDKDAQAVRIFDADCHRFCLAQSFAKNMGLYGERVGALTVICDSKEEADRVLSQMQIVIRSMYSSPPLHGARIVSEILNDPDLYCLWLKDVKVMADRIIWIRTQLKANLVKSGSKHCWDHVTDQIGMFCYTGMNPAAVERITKEFSVYLTKEGRISMASVTTKNVEYLAEAIHTVTK